MLEIESRKRNSRGLTALLDKGYSTGFFTDVVESHGEFIDLIKFGWCTSLITRDLGKKIALCEAHGIDFCFGGTLFEWAFLNEKVPEYVKYCRFHNCRFIEISNGTVHLPAKEKTEFIRELSKEFKVLSEVGFKDTERSSKLSSSEWIEQIEQDLEAGAHKVITESRESGSSGICDQNGEPKFELIEEIAGSGINTDDLLFEAPNKTLQTFFIQRFGKETNLGNISFHDVCGVETLRLGLRSDTLLTINKQI